MRRWFVVVLILLTMIILFPLIAGGQRHGRGSVFLGGRFGPVGPVVTPGRGAPNVLPAVPFAVARPGPPMRHNRHFNRPHVDRPGVITQPFVFYSPYYPFYTMPISPAYPEPLYASPPQPSVSQNELDLAYKVDQLTQEVERLRQEQKPQQQEPAPRQYREPQRPSPPATPTALIFRDGRRMEILNYAITGQTLYVMDGQVLTKIPLADLDLDASQKENQQRGLRFLSAR